MLGDGLTVTTHVAVPLHPSASGTVTESLKLEKGPGLGIKLT